jgi:LCP family protein required for cell wall assembly
VDRVPRPRSGERPESGSDGGGLPPSPPDLDPRGRHWGRGDSAGTGAARRRARYGARLFVSVVCTLLSITLLLLFGTYWWRFNQFKSGISRLNISAATGQNTRDIDGADQNLLVVGNDDRSTATDAELAALGTTRDGGSINTDTMMIIHVPANGSRATLISLPRDSYVAIPGYGMNKLNAAYADAYNAAGGDHGAKQAAGANLLIETVQNLTGLSIDHFVLVDLLGFYRISNAIGGVTVNMCQAVREKNSGINLHQGINVIEGTQALAFVRQRYGFPNGLGDLDRVQRQQYFLTAAFRHVASAGILLNPIKLQNLLNAVQNSIYIDDKLDPLALARQLENLTADNITGKTIPTSFATLPDGTSILRVDPAAVKGFINEIIGSADTKLESAKPVAPSSVTVEVLNAGSGIDGAAATNSATLRTAGFTVSHIGDASGPSSATTIQYADGMQSQAKTLLQYVPGAVLEKSTVAAVTLLLGSDGLTAKIPPAPGSTSAAPRTAAPAPHQALDSTCIN